MYTLIQEIIFTFRSVVEHSDNIQQAGFAGAGRTMMETNSPSLMSRLISFKIKFGFPPTITHFEMRFSAIILIY